MKKKCKVENNSNNTNDSSESEENNKINTKTNDSIPKNDNDINSNNTQLSDKHRPSATLLAYKNLHPDKKVTYSTETNRLPNH